MSDVGPRWSYGVKGVVEEKMNVWGKRVDVGHVEEKVALAAMQVERIVVSMAMGMENNHKDIR
jgi:hypothetical protein